MKIDPQILADTLRAKAQEFEQDGDDTREGAHKRNMYVVAMALNAVVAAVLEASYEAD